MFQKAVILTISLHGRSNLNHSVSLNSGKLLIEKLDDLGDTILDCSIWIHRTLFLQTSIFRVFPSNLQGLLTFRKYSRHYSLKNNQTRLRVSFSINTIDCGTI